MIILGLNAYHGDSSACLVEDGKLIAAAEEERFRRIKHWAGFPSQAIRYCLEERGITLAQVDELALNRNPKANLVRRSLFALTSQRDTRRVFNRLQNFQQTMAVDRELRRYFPGHEFNGRTSYVEHHLAHIASSYLVSPFDKAVVVSLDGSGDFASAAWGIGNGSRIRIDGRIFYPHSLGIFYEAITHFLGFPNYGDEYKMMGLAAYGEPIFLDDMRRIVLVEPDGSFRLDLDFFEHHKTEVANTWNNCAPIVDRLYSPKLEQLIGSPRRQGEAIDQRHKDIARSAQAMYEEALFHLLNKLHERYRLDVLTLAGGCGFNSVANGKLRQRTPFRKLYIQPAAGDAGGAIGAAYVAWHRATNGPHDFVLDSAYLGPRFGKGVVSDLLRQCGDELHLQRCTVYAIEDLDDLIDRTARLIAGGGVVGWFQDRMEWGPRALGNRSIVCDPRRPDMKEVLNVKIKRRESFRPFAPSILRESVADWFETDGDVPFMLQVFQVRAEKRSLIPAVTHVDGSGRLQTVREAENPRFYRLIKRFADLTGVPMVLNTSFNENEPVVCRPEEAIDCFLRTKMDALVLENQMVLRPEAVHATTGEPIGNAFVRHQIAEIIQS
jgi:carbamoyltransferase